MMTPTPELDRLLEKLHEAVVGELGRGEGVAGAELL